MNVINFFKHFKPTFKYPHQKTILSPLKIIFNKELFHRLQGQFIASLFYSKLTNL